ncbi:glucosaminidase domain-containing protein [Clostridium estertheticum]|uniref:glucosaminidase domain-containing protein n=1 Tax=Clostridium estertheticum TaxID=238834 RepID=UPI0013E91D5D|nr:glucosaminidase domain-containing protein [Clostridium estertheticum]MBZ9686347.1 glucosaminidase domain-containing protein [Clostridium estertheticum]
MKNVIDELKASFVLKSKEIERIKLYVVKKYPNNSSKENASILSKTMYEIIDKNLEGINTKQKQNIKRNIMKSTILKDKENILKWDVFNAYIIESEENPQLKISLIEWINKNQKNTVSQKNFEEYLDSLHNSSDIKKSSYIEIKSPAKHQGVSAFKHNFRSALLKYKKQLALKINSISKEVEAVLNKIYSTKIALSVLALLILFLYLLNNPINSGEFLGDKNERPQVYASNIEKYDLYVTDAMSYHPYLPDYFNYKTIDKDKLLNFLKTRNSMLAEEPYFSAIIRASREFNLNPHVLFAITGQEQSFVPKSDENAQKIANNPFNVFHSWKEYNTSIYDSSRIAARTVINLAKDKPVDIDIFDWINNKYANDKNWGSGVRKIFEMLDELLYDFHVKK